MLPVDFNHLKVVRNIFATSDGSTSQTLCMLVVLLTDCYISNLLVPIHIKVRIESMLDEIMIIKVLIAVII